jgi:hypothetical protein
MSLTIRKLEEYEIWANMIKKNNVEITAVNKIYKMSVSMHLLFWVPNHYYYSWPCCVKEVGLCFLVRSETRYF